MWLIVGEIPIKAGWGHASIALLDFSQSIKHRIHLSTGKTIYLSRFVFAMFAFQKQSSKVVLLKKLPEACNFIKKQICHRCFPVNFAKFFENNFFQRTSSMAASGICTNRDFLF